ncbi:hypothetical protein K461DRAFT_273461 [Myriangium duriaei CBS 260.36]|uniref:DUF7702 domain-containing protein n=1 Tax=Myriangium duriaei CBS 260.36 TaxID=1168546 RepID=A0A9P4JC04_9PEZI|nr:hypothetical protein K461DRAFT_273461 [Myriangium duriaei CBS 260.36]
MLSPHEILDIVELVYYVPVLFISAFVCFKHGFTRSSGYLYLVILSLLRLIGASTGIAAVQHPSNTNLLIASIVCSGIGLSPLLLALLGFTDRIHSNSVPGPVIPKKALRIARIPIVVALILGIVAGTDMSSSKPSDRSHYHTYSKASALLYLLSLLIVTAVLLITYLTRNRILPTDSKLLYAGLFAIPFLFVRTLYSILVAFDYNNSKTFSLINNTTRATVVQACMSLLMEFIVVATYLVAAILTPRLEPAREGQFQGQNQHELPKYGAQRV